MNYEYEKTLSHPVPIHSQRERVEYKELAKSGQKTMMNWMKMKKKMVKMKKMKKMKNTEKKTKTIH